MAYNKANNYINTYVGRQLRDILHLLPDFESFQGLIEVYYNTFLDFENKKRGESVQLSPQLRQNLSPHTHIPNISNSDILGICSAIS